MGGTPITSCRTEKGPPPHATASPTPFQPGSPKCSHLCQKCIDLAIPETRAKRRAPLALQAAWTGCESLSPGPALALFDDVGIGPSRASVFPCMEWGQAVLSGSQP